MDGAMDGAHNVLPPLDSLTPGKPKDWSPLTSVNSISKFRATGDGIFGLAVGGAISRVILSSVDSFLFCPSPLGEHEVGGGAMHLGLAVGRGTACIVVFEGIGGAGGAAFTAVRSGCLWPASSKHGVVGVAVGFVTCMHGFKPGAVKKVTINNCCK